MVEEGWIGNVLPSLLSSLLLSSLLLSYLLLSSLSYAWETYILLVVWETYVLSLTISKVASAIQRVFDVSAYSV